MRQRVHGLLTLAPIIMFQPVVAELTHERDGWTTLPVTRVLGLTEGVPAKYANAALMMLSLISATSIL